ncbi:CobD/CbiB family cobalamin biosynthesis protein [Massilia sp. YIM B02769]|uniref:CobD/CbiB family cobalamin biosynthesis protein n=1 Tax=Massilia sp. YIM B02769 TaxID=3050129 RepID=UPI0025B6D226|nr:CobD/CbiB family cobalamin biosynthesis protein [Massilia sp. YIM B02769]
MLSGLSASALALLLVAGVALDLVLGEARRWHPLVGFGRLANALEARLNRSRWRLARGALAWVLAVLPLTLLAWWLTAYASLLVHALLLYLALGLRSLREHTMPIFAALRAGELAEARRLTGRIVSRDTADADPSDLAKAGAESLLENGNDAVFGTLFWFVVAGGPGALLFRLANTLDAMWGYRSERFNLFGRVAARIDDALNLVPARLTALSYVLLAPRGGHLRAWRCWRTQAPAWSSPNAGPVMASGAGALGIALGGAARYDGVVEQRPPLGLGRAAAPEDIERAWRLVLHSTLLWVAAVCVAALLIDGVGHA